MFGIERSARCRKPPSDDDDDDDASIGVLARSTMLDFFEATKKINLPPRAQLARVARARAMAPQRVRLGGSDSLA